uniref:Serpentine receptor class gamma n=1 Tax=Panagrellus redivivus TaxID=6233 RepID=A0A7E4W3X2_PANRE
MRKKFMSWPSMIIQHVLGYAVCFAVAIPIWYAIVDEKDYPAYMARYDPSTFNEIKPGDVYGFLDEKSPIWKWYCIMALVGFCYFFFGSLLLSAYIIRQISKNARKFTEKTYRLHLQLSFILVVQIILPLIFVVGPLSIVFFYFVYWEQPLSSNAAYIGVTLLTVYPSTNTFITIVGVTPYRNFTTNWIMAIIHFLKRPCFGKQRIQPRSGSIVPSTTVVPH